MIELAAAICLATAATLGLLLWRCDARLRVADRRAVELEKSRAELAALIDAAPMSAFIWKAGRDVASATGTVPGEDDSPRRAVTFASFRDSLAAEDAAFLDQAIGALEQDGERFSARLTTRTGDSYHTAGCVTATGERVVWVADASSAHRAESIGHAAATAASALREMFDAIPFPIWRRDRDLALADCNLAFAAALDTSREQALAENRELAPQAGREKALDLARRALIGAAVRERRHLVVAGSRRLLEIAEVPLDTVGTIGFAIDRTDLESAEAELSRHINAHAEVLESIHAAVAIYGSDKRLKFFNTAFAALWGLDQEWLRGEPSLDEVLERLRERRRIPEFADFRAFRRQQLQMFTSLIQPQQELMHLPDDRTLSLSISPHPFGGLTFVYEDVTDRLALERSFNTLTEVQRETLDHLFEGIAVYGSDGRLKLHNPAYREIWALSEAEVAGEPHISDIVEKTRAFYDRGGDWPAMKEQIIAKITAHALTSEPLDRQDGSVLQHATVPLPDGNVLITCIDVTDTTRFERALRERNEALETAGRLKSEFIANVSYELRTPLNAIIGFAEILTNQYFGALSSRQLDYSRGILDSSHRLMSLINDILDLATIEAGYMTLETKSVDVCEMLRAVLTLTRERARNQNLELSLSCAPETGSVEADERRLKQALFNLISNAIKFTPAGGSIDVAARREGSDLVFAVSDTGVGIPAADQERVFEKFERGNPQGRHSGAGLGLSLVKSLIELHGGSVEIDSQPGRGTTVLCRLPSAQPARPDTHADAPSRSRFAL